jgi:hypothetical protein
MNVKQKQKKKRKKAWKQKVNKTYALALKLKFQLVDKSAWVPGSRLGYYHYNSFTGRMDTLHCLLNDKSEIIMEDRLPEVENYLKRLWELKVFL